MLPRCVDRQYMSLPYRGDDTRLNRWQRMLMLFVGIGGLWFIPTFHNITKLSPFLGAMCVLSILWIVNEVVNRKLMNVDVMIQRRTPRVLQYGVIQLLLFVMGIILAIGVMTETGVVYTIAQWCDDNIHNIWIMGVAAGLMSTVVDTFASSSLFAALHGVVEPFRLGLWVDTDYMSMYLQNGLYWKVIAYSAAMGGNILLLGSTSGLALMKMERVHVGWYFRNVGSAVAVSWLLGLAVMWLMSVC